MPLCRTCANLKRTAGSISCPDGMELYQPENICVPKCESGSQWNIRSGRCLRTCEAGTTRHHITNRCGAAKLPELTKPLCQPGYKKSPTTGRCEPIGQRHSRTRNMHSPRQVTGARGRRAWSLLLPGHVALTTMINVPKETNGAVRVIVKNEKTGDYYSKVLRESEHLDDDKERYIPYKGVNKQWLSSGKNNEKYTYALVVNDSNVYHAKYLSYQDVKRAMSRKSVLRKTTTEKLDALMSSLQAKK